jgi:hypothetical protein
MPKYVIERQYLVPMCQHIVVEGRKPRRRLQEGDQRRYLGIGVSPVKKAPARLAPSSIALKKFAPSRGRPLTDPRRRILLP